MPQIVIATMIVFAVGFLFALTLTIRDGINNHKNKKQ